MIKKFFSTGIALSAMVILIGCGVGDIIDNGDTPVPANNMISGEVIFDGYADAGISTEGAWIRITPTVFASNEYQYKGVLCEIAYDGSFGSNCVFKKDEAAVREAFAAQDGTFSYVIFRDSFAPYQAYGCDEDSFGGDFDVTLAEITTSPIIVTTDFYKPGTPCQ